MVLLLVAALALGVHGHAEDAEQPLDLGEAAALLQNSAPKPGSKRHLMSVAREPRPVADVMTAATGKVARLEAQLRALPAPAGDRALVLTAQVREQVERVAAKNRTELEKALALLDGGGKLGYDVAELKAREEYVFRARMDLTYGWFLIQPLNESLAEWGKSFAMDFPLKPEVTLQDFCANDLAPSKELDAILFQLDPSTPHSPAPGVCDALLKH